MANPDRGVLIAGNWKMNHTLGETERFFSELKAKAPQALPAGTAEAFRSGRLRGCLIPPQLALERSLRLARELPFPLEIASQNAHWEKQGAFTGEVSGPMLQELGIRWALVGHSERRQLFGETDETARKRSESLLTQGFVVLFCVGETRAERESGQTHAVLSRQLSGALPERGKGAASFLDGRLVIAYEPVWAIGTGLTATPEQAQEAHQALRGMLDERFGPEAAAKTQLLYGGSVAPSNIDSLLACPDVDGALVGGASLKPESFLALLAAGARRCP
ncbi:MAG: triose-phosphate isomerase [Oligoflexia bacterium]|nr:triose-phosphate isomerase [Oligoflexia bacterium]